jgi:hypothetical protein
MRQLEESIFIDGGYVKHEPMPYFRNDSNANYQKCIRKDGIGEKLFFLNIYEYDISHFAGCEYYQYTARVQFGLPNGEVFDVERQFFNDSMTLEELESFFMKIFKTFDCLTYDGYEQDYNHRISEES